MFKSLRDKLKGFAKKAASEMTETELSDKVERELQEAMRQEALKTAPPAATPSPATPAAPAAPAPRPATPTATAPPVPVTPPPVTTSPVTSAQAAPVARPPATPAPPPTPAPPVSSHVKPAPSGPAPPVPPDQPRSPPSTSPVPTAPVTSSAGISSQHVAAPTASIAPPIHVPPEAAKPRPAQPGRKIHTEEEIEARLERELREAVAVQRTVEETVGVTGRLHKFTISSEVLEEILWDLEVGLLESDVALPVIEAIKRDVKEQLLSIPVSDKKPEEVIEKVLRAAIKRVLQVNPLDFDAFVRQRIASGKKPVVLMFVGVNGTGKTTSIARIAYRLKGMGVSCCMAAGDTFRAGAIEQLALHGERLGIAVIKHKGGADPAAVAFDAIEHAKARNKDVVLLDTAGRMQNNSNLMDEMDKIRRVANPDLCIFVGDSLAGNDAVEQARKFDEVVDVGGAILTKVDVDAKGGAALSVAYTINKPLLFVGVGQDYPDLKPFDAEWLVNRLFGDDEAEQEQVASA